MERIIRLSGHSEHDPDLVDFISTLSARRVPADPGPAQEPVAELPATARERARSRQPRRWKVPFVAVASVFFAAIGGIALAAQAPAPEPPPVECTLVVPAAPLTAAGLATPYQLDDPCKQSDPGTSAFVQATIIDPATGAISVYNPLVVDEGTRPAVPTVVPQLPPGAVVGIWFGFNGDNLRLRGTGDSLTQGHCVTGLGDSIFGQFSYCGAQQFFTAANAAIAAGRLAVPPPGTARDGQTCPTTRDYALVDMDQSDNVTSSYLFLPNGSTAQNTAVNRDTLAAKGAKIEVNGSDNRLLDAFVMPALGCTPFTAPDLADPGVAATSLALNELQAAAYQAAPVALVPTTDPMTLVGDNESVAKTNLYRAGVNMPPVDRADPAQSPKAYCGNLTSIGVTRIQRDKAFTDLIRSPDPGAADSLFTFLASRLGGSFDVLNCGALLHIPNPVAIVSDENDVAIGARFAAVPPPPSPSAPVPPSPSARPTVSTPPSVPAPVPASPSTAPSTRPAAPPSNPPTPSQAVPVPPTTRAPAPPATPHTAAQPAPGRTTGAAVPPAAMTPPASTGPSAMPALPVAATPRPTLTEGAMPLHKSRGAAAGTADSAPVGVQLRQVAVEGFFGISAVLALVALIRFLRGRRRMDLAESWTY